jgi:hypothetical protein
MGLEVGVKTPESGNIINSKIGSASLAEKDGKKFLITADHVVNPENGAGQDDTFLKNSATNKEISLDPFKQVGKYDLAVNELDRKEIESLEKAGVDTNNTLKLPEIDSELPTELTTTSNFKGGKNQEPSQHEVALANNGSEQQNIINEPGETNKKYDTTSQTQITDPEDKLGKGSSGGGLENKGILYGVVSTEITDDGTTQQATKGNINAVDLRNEEIQAAIGKALSVAA